MKDYSTIKTDIDAYIATLEKKDGLILQMSQKAYDQLVIQNGGKKLKKYKGIAISIGMPQIK